ncbi:MAG: sulfotransferase, partial [Bacteroidota bacterium]
MHTREPINLLYIASIGRSGSTLLDSMLGAHSHVDSVGEIHIWPHELLGGGIRATGSGLMVQDDPFWQEMLGRVDPLAQPGPQLHHFREAHDAGRTLRLERVADFGPGPLPRSVAAQVDAYGRNNYEIFRAFQDTVEAATGRRPAWIVDASKDPYRLIWLIRSGWFNVRVVHMVKNPRGFIYSVTKPHIHASDHGRRLAWTFRQAGAWNVRNALIQRAARHHLAPDHYLLVQYEAFASDPRHWFAQICTLAGLPFEAEAVESFRAGCPFAIAGNPMRAESRGIYLDEK